MKKMTSFVCTVMLLVMGVSIACAWGGATHTYFADRLGAKFGFSDLNEMYGAVLPDAFNTMFDPTGDYLYGLTHDKFELFLNGASKCDLKAVSFGFVCHNDLWGADFIAHHSGFTTPGEGYVIAKGNMLVGPITDELITILTPYIGPDNAAYVASQLAPSLGEDLVETAIDVLVKRTEDPGIGLRMLLAAKVRSPGTPSLLASAYANDLAAFATIPVGQATNLIIAMEKGYREQMITYGSMFCLNEKRTIEALAAQSAGLASLILNANIGVEVPVPPALVEQYLRKAMAIAQPDYRHELKMALCYLEGVMRSHHIPTCYGWFAKGEPSEQPEAETIEAPVGFSLGDNYPNPFNPTTTIDYSVPSDARVLLTVYNSLGQEVATLVDAEVAAGWYKVSWDAGGVASGVYFYRLTAGNNSTMKRMLLLK